MTDDEMTADEFTKWISTECDDNVTQDRSPKPCMFIEEEIQTLIKAWFIEFVKHFTGNDWHNLRSILCMDRIGILRWSISQPAYCKPSTPPKSSCETNTAIGGKW